MERLRCSCKLDLAICLLVVSKFTDCLETECDGAKMSCLGVIWEIAFNLLLVFLFSLRNAKTMY